MYRDASRVVEEVLQQREASSKRKRARGKPFNGLKTMVLSEDFGVKNKAKTYAIACQVLKSKDLIDRVLERAQLKHQDLARHRGLFYAMTYDLLFGKGKIQGGGAVKRAIIAKRGELEDALKQEMQEEDVQSPESLLMKNFGGGFRDLPRYARVNLIKSSVETVLTQLAPAYEVVQDPLISYVLRFPPNTKLYDHALVKNGSLILQDKSSCFPAFALREIMARRGLRIYETDVIDATAAPGNKTSQLAASGFRKVFAFDKSSERLKVLEKRIKQSGAEKVVKAACKDFLKIDAGEIGELSKVKGILLDPSCSGSGMVGRVDHSTDRRTRKELKQRLSNLASFQKKALLHAMSFPNVEVVTYSTCSIHQEENEDVVAHCIALNQNFRLVENILTEWMRRGQGGSLRDVDAEKVIRVAPSEGDDASGFFLAVFERVSCDPILYRSSQEEEEVFCPRSSGLNSQEKKKSKKKRKRDISTPFQKIKKKKRTEAEVLLFFSKNKKR